jgi:hypothetical protein
MYDVVNTTETGGITVPPHSDAVMSASHVGTVRFYYESALIQSAAGDGAACP